MNRLQRLFEEKIPTGEKLLSCFLTAGYPQLESTKELVLAVEKAGADFIELGMPFSDPVADGAIIQISSQQAIKNGMTMQKLISQVKEIREESEIPIVLMGYFNPFLRYDVEKLVPDAEAVGVDGFIIPDLLPDDYHRFSGAFKKQNIGLNYLVSPNTTAERIKEVGQLTHDFLYCVSVTGVTGARSGLQKKTVGFLETLRELVSRPYFVGFGIATPADAAQAASYSNGVIVGSAFIKLLEQDKPYSEKVSDVAVLVSHLKSALNKTGRKKW